MRAYLIGPPPRQLIEMKGNRWAGKGRRLKLVTLHLKDANEDERPIEEIGLDEPLYANVKYKSRMPGAAYGSSVSRVVITLPISDKVTKETLTAGTLPWEMFFDPIRSWEAWQVADAEDMTLQGIEYRDPTGRLRVYLEEADEYHTMRIAHQAKGCTTDEAMDLMPTVERCLASPPRGMEAEAKFLTERNSRIPDVETAMVLLIAESLMEHQMPNLGWKVADVWRMDAKSLSIQAKKFNLKKGKWLLERLHRRKQAAKRNSNKR